MEAQPAYSEPQNNKDGYLFFMFVFICLTGVWFAADKNNGTEDYVSPPARQDSIIAVCPHCGDTSTYHIK